MSDNFKHNKLINKVSDMFSNKTFDERKDINLFMANQQLITVEQTKHKINQQHKKLLTELQGWEDNISKQITKLLGEKERSVNNNE